MKKNLYCLFMVFTLLASQIVYADTGVVNDKGSNYYEYSYDDLSNLTGFSVEDIIEFESSDISVENFDEEISRAIKMHKSNEGIRLEDENIKQVRQSIPGGSAYIQSITKVGDIHVTSIGTTYGFEHGHAALAYDKYTNIETYGKNSAEPVSALISNTGWGNYTRYGLLRPNNATDSQKSSIVRWGKDNALGLEYSAFSGKGTSKVNCSSLVAKIYDGAGYDILPYYGTHNTVYPEDLVTTSRTTKVYDYYLGW